MKINIIAACDNNRGIGKNNDLPWPKISKDLKYFKYITTGYPILMGRKTFESIGSKPLPNRKNYILTSKNIDSSDVYPVISLYYVDEPEIFVIGGAQVYETFWDVVDKIYITEINGTFDCDTFIPPIPPFFELVSETIDFDLFELKFKIYKNTNYDNK